MNVPGKGTHSKSFSVEVHSCDLADSALPSIVTLEAAYEGDEPPVFSFALGDVFESIDYDFGGKGAFRRNQWRVPPFVDSMAALTLHVAIPEGTIVRIRAFGCSSSAWRVPWTGGVRLNAHLGFWGYAPENTQAAASAAALCGYPACIVVPKATKDGELVCIHDDTINRTARNAEGGTPGDAPVLVHDLTLAELREWEFGGFKHPVWKGEPIMLLADFFDLCAKTGMRPMFSTHPALARDEWMRVQAMLETRGLLRQFHVKSFDPETLRGAYAVFGTGIEGYTLDVGTNEEAYLQAVETMDSIGIDKTRCRTGIELFYKSMTSERCATIKAAGHFPAVWALSHAPARRFRDFIRMGVTEFTDDFNCSFGLDW